MLFITTCGTSILSKNLDTQQRAKVTKLANLEEFELSKEDKLFLDQKFNQQANRLLGANFEEAKNLSAELNGIITYLPGKFPTAFQHSLFYLIHTQTYQGQMVANLLKVWLEKNQCRSETFCIRNLNTKSVSEFKSGISSLITWCEKTLPGFRDSNYKLIFNLTGGFKALQGFMQTLGMFYADELVYIFEGNDELLRIPRLPIQLDSSVESAVINNLIDFRKLGALGSMKAKCPVIPETLVEEADNLVGLSNWGQLVWEKLRTKIYQTQKLDPVGHVIFSKSGLDAFNRLPKNYYFSWNERMDDLFHYYESGKKECIKRLDYKRIKGNPCPPSTHECDLCSNQGAWRIFGHEDNNQFVIDDIGPGLH